MSQRENADRTQALVVLPATGIQTGARNLCRRLFPTTQYHGIFLARFFNERSLWNGPIRSSSKPAARPLNRHLTSRCRVFLENFTVTQMVKKFITFMKPSPLPCSQKPAIRSQPEPTEFIPCFFKINSNSDHPHIIPLTEEFAVDLVMTLALVCARESQPVYHHPRFAGQLHSLE